jgi:hypothetical protein
MLRLIPKDREEWRPLVYDAKDGNAISGRYLISNHGRLYSKDRGIERKFQTKVDKSGYPKVVVKLSEVGTTNGMSYYMVSRLVALAFIPNPDNLPIVNHLSGDSTYNYYKNLEWASFHRNTMHAIEYGLIKSQLTYDQVHQVCKMMEVDNWDYGQIGLAIIGTSNVKDNKRFFSLLVEIAIGKKYKSISDQYNIKPNRKRQRKYDDETVHAVCRYLVAGRPHNYIAGRLAIDIGFVENVYRKRVQPGISDQYFTKEEIYSLYKSLRGVD